MIPILVLICVLTFLHYVGAQMRAAPVLPLYAAAHGATATGVGLIIGTHMMTAAVGSITLGRASDIWGRRALLLGGMAVAVVTSLLLPLAEHEIALVTIDGLAGFGVAAFTPAALSLVGDAAAPGRAGHAFAWYSTAHYGAIAIGPFIGGLVADRWGYVRPSSPALSVSPSPRSAGSDCRCALQPRGLSGRAPPSLTSEATRACGRGGSCPSADS